MTIFDELYNLTSYKLFPGAKQVYVEREDVRCMLERAKRKFGNNCIRPKCGITQLSNGDIHCDNCNRHFSIKYKYCPWCGYELEDEE